MSEPILFPRERRSPRGPRRRLVEVVVPVRAVHLDRKGRGRALRHVWSASVADVVAYMDVDLSTDLNGFLPLVTPLLSGHSDLAIGSRLARGAHTTRGPKREIISRCYNLVSSYARPACSNFPALNNASASPLSACAVAALPSSGAAAAASVAARRRVLADLARGRPQPRSRQARTAETCEPAGPAGQPV